MVSIGNFKHSSPAIKQLRMLDQVPLYIFGALFTNTVD